MRLLRRRCRRGTRRAVGDERDEEVCGFRGTEGLREVRFDRFLLGAAVGRVHGDDVELLALFEVAHVAFE